jgi:hypothetical protein
LVFVLIYVPHITLSRMPVKSLRRLVVAFT